MTRRTVRALSRELPRELKELRAKLMFEPLRESLGVEEVACPACRATGWLHEGRFERCPICCGFREVPRSLADWFRDRLRIGLRRRPSAEPPAASAAAERHAEVDKVAYRVSLPPGCDLLVLAWAGGEVEG